MVLVGNTARTMLPFVGLMAHMQRIERSLTLRPPRFVALLGRPCPKIQRNGNLAKLGAYLSSLFFLLWELLGKALLGRFLRELGTEREPCGRPRDMQHLLNYCGTIPQKFGVFVPHFRPPEGTLSLVQQRFYDEWALLDLNQ